MNAPTIQGLDHKTIEAFNATLSKLALAMMAIEHIMENDEGSDETGLSNHQRMGAMHSVMQEIVREIEVQRDWLEMTLYPIPRKEQVQCA